MPHMESAVHLSDVGTQSPSQVLPDIELVQVHDLVLARLSALRALVAAQ